MSNKITPPWSAETVSALAAYQADGRVHPFTCPGSGNCPNWKDDAKRRLTPTESGWKCSCGGYTQDWAWPFMAAPMHVEGSIGKEALAHVGALIEQVRAAGLTEAAEMFETSYWAWLKVIQAYRCAAPYVEKPDPGHPPYSALSVVEYTIRHWGRLIPGTPSLDNEEVRKEAAIDEAWHREEDRRMRREAGEIC